MVVYSCKEGDNKMEEEIWKPIKDYEGLYEVSNLGRVKSLNYRGTGKWKILKNIECSNGYLVVVLTKNGKRKQFKVHRLVAEAFIPNPENKPCVDHINTIRTKNYVWNLRWVTHEENNNNPLTKKKYSENHREQTGENNPMYGRTLKNHPMYGRIGENNPKSKPVIQIDLNTNEIIKVWASAMEAERQGEFNNSAINQCCRGKRKSHKGYKWMYLYDYNKLSEKN